VTFPNHISIVTGLYPEHHGIVANDFYDPARKEFYEIGKSARDGSWYRAKPLWVVAEEQKVKSASMFWPTSDAEILGVRPSYWKPYDRTFPDEQRVAQVLECLKLPEDRRPHFITVYFGDTDSAGHSYGPDSAEIQAAVHWVDALVGELWKGIQVLNLPVNLIVVSDHGMQKVEGFVDLSKFADFKELQVADDGAFTLLYAPNAEIAERTYVALKGKSPECEVYRRKETPPRLHFSDDPRIGDLVVIANGPKILGTKPPPGAGLMQGEHGYDPAETFFRSLPKFLDCKILPPWTARRVCS
jgi:predicted AlkP superfamily pyrophosphatase or phosphodiesterase